MEGANFHSTSASACGLGDRGLCKDHFGTQPSCPFGLLHFLPFSHHFFSSVPATFFFPFLSSSSSITYISPAFVSLLPFLSIIFYPSDPTAAQPFLQLQTLTYPSPSLSLLMFLSTFPQHTLPPNHKVKGAQDLYLEKLIALLRPSFYR